MITTSNIMLFLIILIIMLLFQLGITIYGIIRNEWVYKERTKLLSENYETYLQLPSYEEILEGHGFWRWDINYYLNKGENEDISN